MGISPLISRADEARLTGVKITAGPHDEIAEVKE
jgi:hypothetical protein